MRWRSRDQNGCRGARDRRSGGVAAYLRHQHGFDPLPSLDALPAAGGSGTEGGGDKIALFESLLRSRSGWLWGRRRRRRRLGRGDRRRSGLGFHQRRPCLGFRGPEAESDGGRAKAHVLALDSFQAEVLIELFFRSQVLLTRGGNGLAVFGGLGFQLGLLAKEAFFELAGSLGGFAFAAFGS